MAPRAWLGVAGHEGARGVHAWLHLAVHKSTVNAVHLLGYLKLCVMQLPWLVACAELHLKLPRIPSLVGK